MSVKQKLKLPDCVHSKFMTLENAGKVVDWLGWFSQGCDEEILFAHKVL